MDHTKTLSLSTLTVSLILLAGCTTQTATNTNTANQNTESASGGNTEVVANTNETVVNDNTNTEPGNEVDTSDEVLRSPEDEADWLTYTNDEYGFSFKYPSDWQISKDIFEEYKKSFDNPRYQVNEKDAVFLTSLTTEEIDSEIYQYQNQSDEMGQGVIESIGKGKLILITVSDKAVADLVSQPGFTFTIGEDITLNDSTEATNVYLEKRWEGNSDYHYVYIPFQGNEKTNMDKQVKSVAVYVETNGGDYDQETLLNITKTFQKSS